MRAEDALSEYARYEADSRRDATHMLVVGSDSKFLRIPDDEGGQNLIGEMTEALLGTDVGMKEMPTRTFALTIPTVLHCDEDAQDLFRTLGKACAQALIKEVFSEKQTLAVIFFMSKSGVGQLVFPDLVVDKERARHVRMFLITALSGSETESKLLAASSNNQLGTVIGLADDAGFDVPFLKTVAMGPTPQLGDDLSLVATVDITASAVSKRPRTGTRSAFIVSCLKRRDARSEFSNLTEWDAPASAQRQKGTGAGGSHPSTSSSSTRDPAGPGRGRGSSATASR